MKQLPSILILLLVLSGSAFQTHLVFASEIIQARFGDVNLNLPYPDELCLLKRKGPDEPMFSIHQEGQRKQGNKLLSVWIDCDSRQKLDRGIPVPKFNEWVIVVGSLSGNPRKEKIYPNLSREFFSKMIAKQMGAVSWSKTADKVNQDVNKILSKYLSEGKTIKIKEPISLGVLGITDSVHSGIILNVLVGQQHSNIIAITSATLIKGAPIFFYHYRPYKNKSTVQSLLAKAKYYSIKLTHGN